MDKLLFFIYMWYQAFGHYCTNVGSGFWTHACRDSVTLPIWLTLSNRQLQALFSTALAMRLGLVTVRSSPTTCMSVLLVKLVQASQSSWSKGSSMETTRVMIKTISHLCSNKKICNVIKKRAQMTDGYLDNPEWNFCKGQQAHQGWCTDWGHRET